MNIGEWVFKRAMTNPDGPFLKEEERDDRQFTNAEFNLRVNRMAHALYDMGIRRGDRVGALLLNSSEFLEIFFACAKTGAIMVPMNFRLAMPELAYILGDSSPKVVFYSSDFADNVQGLKAKHKEITNFIKHGGEELLEDPKVSELILKYPDTEPAVEVEVTENDPLTIMYTSGTTGDPKGAVLSHNNILFDAIHNLIGYSLNRSYRSLVSAPMFHIGALAASVTPIIYAGGSLVLKRFFNASEMLKLITTEKINYMFTVPVMFHMMTEAEGWAGADFSHVYYFFAGGAPMPIHLIKKYQDEKGVSFAQGYGMTETCQISSLSLEDSTRKAGSVGKEVFHMTMRIVDDDDNDVPDNEVGEIVLKGPNIFLGYWNKPKETTDAMRGGWFHTGDLGRRDDEGFLYIVGRKVELIISSGENVYPIEVEKAIMSLPEIKEAAAIGIPDPKRGEVVCAFVLLEENMEINEEEIVERLMGKIANFKIPKKFIFTKELPRNSTGKILKRELKKML
jgi:fatty-acyl-CoA synthase